VWNVIRAHGGHLPGAARGVPARGARNHRSQGHGPGAPTGFISRKLVHRAPGTAIVLRVTGLDPARWVV